MLYELTTLGIRLGTVGRVTEGVAAWTGASDARGTLLGCWSTEIGTINDVIVLRSFPDARSHEEERRRLEASTSPFGAGDALRELTCEAYRPFPFLPPVQPGAYGPIYEFRTYLLKQGGVPPTLASWEAALPERTRLSPLTVAMIAMDGPPRFTHIWPYASLDERSRVRTESVKLGLWPPKGGPDWLTGEMSSVIALPTAISPLA